MSIFFSRFKLFLTLCFFSLYLFAQTPNLPNHSYTGQVLRNGDLILLPQDCTLCDLIETETSSPFSHMGMMIYDESALRWDVMEAGSWVQRIPLEKFLKKAESNQKIIIMRHQDLASQLLSAEKIISAFKSYEHKPYDSLFLWNNQIKGQEAIYCSELIYLMLKKLDLSVPPLKVMNFKVNREGWQNYYLRFKSTIPENELGISPMDFFHASLFQVIGAIQ